MAIEVILKREGTKLVAADSISAESIAGIRENETVTASIRRPRNTKHHRLLFALLNAVFEQQTSFATIQQLLGVC